MLVSKPIQVSARAGSEGKLFGSVTSADLATAIEEQTGVQIDRKMIDLSEAIRSIGAHSVTVKAHTEVEFPIMVSVVEA